MDTTILRLALGALGLVAAVYLLWPQVAVWLDRVKQPVCARCRYPAAGIPTLVCPECGSDLRQVGILTPHMLLRRAPGQGGALAAWTFGWAVLGIIAATALSLFVAGRLQSSMTSPLRAADDPGLSLTFLILKEGWRAPPTECRFALTLAHASHTALAGSIEFEWPEARVLASTGAARPTFPVGSRVDAAALAGWLRGSDLPDPERAAEHLIDDVVRLADAPYNSVGGWTNGPAWIAGGSSLSVRNYTPGWVHAALAAAALALWLAGAARLIARRPGRRGTSSTGDPVTPAS